MNTQPPAPDRRSRPWAATGGRILTLESGSDIRPDTQVTTLETGTLPSGSAYLRILSRCRNDSVAVTELAAHLDVPLGIAGAMVAQLRDDGHVEAKALFDMASDGVVTTALLRRVRDGLHKNVS